MLKEKLEKWQKKAITGNEKFRCWKKQKGIWRMTDDNGVHDIDTIYLCIRSKKDVLLEEYWKKGDGNQETKDIIIAEKTNHGILVSDDMQNLWGFGFAEKEFDTRVLLCYRIGQIVDIVWSESAGCAVYYAYSLNEYEADSDSLECLFDFFKIDMVHNREKGEAASVYDGIE